VSQAGDPSARDGAVPGDGEPHSLPASGDPVDHLWSAAHEFLCAFRAMIDAADAVVLD